MAITSYTQEEAKLAQTAKANGYDRARFEAEILPKFRAGEIDAEGNIQEKPAKPKSMADVIKSGLKSYAKATFAPLAEMQQGAITGLVRGAGNIGGMIPLPGLGEKFKKSAEGTAQMLEQRGQNFGLNAQSIPSQVGQFAGESTISAPIGGVLTKGITKIPGVSKLPGMVQGALTGATQSGTYGAVSRGYISTSDLVLGGTLGAAGNLIEKIGSKLPEKLKESAAKGTKQALGPTKEKYKQMAEKITPEFLKKGLVGSREALQEKAAIGMEEIGSKIDDMFATGKVKGMIKTKPILQGLEELKTKVGNIDIDPARSKVIDDMKDIVIQFGKELDPDKARALRQGLDKVVYSTKGIIADEALSIKNLARKNIADNIRSQLGSANPDLQALNKEFNFWSNLDEILTATALRTGPQQGGFVSKIAGASAGASAVTKISAWKAAMVAIATKQFVSAVQSPLWRTISAQTKNKLADALASGNKNAIIKTISEIQKSIPKIQFATAIKDKILGLK